MTADTQAPERRDLKIAVLVPNYDNWKAGFGWSISNMMTHFAMSPYAHGDKDIELISSHGSMIPDVRHKLIAEATKWGASHVLWADCDMIFPRRALHMLLRHGPPIVGVNYARREIPTQPTAYQDGDDYTGLLYTDPKVDYRENPLVEVAHMGFGLQLCDIRVFDHVGLPYFAFEPLPPYGLRVRSEDVFFCGKVRRAGLKLFVDQELSQQVEHIGELKFSHAMACESRDALQRQRDDLIEAGGGVTRRPDLVMPDGRPFVGGSPRMVDRDIAAVSVSGPALDPPDSEPDLDDVDAMARIYHQEAAE